MILFHGGTNIVEHPVVIIGEQGRDFGFAFYATDIRDQAERWARRQARYRGRMTQSEVRGDRLRVRVRRERMRRPCRPAVSGTLARMD